MILKDVIEPPTTFAVAVASLKVGHSMPCTTGISTKPKPEFVTETLFKRPIALLPVVVYTISPVPFSCGSVFTEYKNLLLVTNLRFFSPDNGSFCIESLDPLVSTPPATIK